MALIVRGIKPNNVFRVFGSDENSATFALGWVLEQSPTFRRLLIEDIFDVALDSDNTVIELQKHGEDGGFTDIELQAGRQFHAILEAKRWWDIPSIEQLTRYLPRLKKSNAPHQRLVSISAADRAYAQRHLPGDLGGVGIVHLAWSDLRTLAATAKAQVSGFEEKLWLRQLIRHLGEFASMRQQTDNVVFVVSLSKDPIVSGQAHTWIDVIEKDSSYFHPIEKRWPVQPPNYIGFRYHGKLQSVHHIDSFKVVRNLASENPLWLKTDSDHFVYQLGPAMRPLTEVRTGKIYMSHRVKCAIDTLLSGAYPTISDARDETQRRLSDED